MTSSPTACPSGAVMRPVHRDGVADRVTCWPGLWPLSSAGPWPTTTSPSAPPLGQRSLLPGGRVDSPEAAQRRSGRRLKYFPCMSLLFFYKKIKKKFFLFIFFPFILRYFSQIFQIFIDYTYIGTECFKDRTCSPHTVGKI